MSYLVKLIFVFSGNMRRFRRICEHTQSVVSVVRRPLPPNSPRAQRRVTSGPTTAMASNNNTVDGRMMAGVGSPGKSGQGATAEISESSSNNSDISERLQGNKLAVATTATAGAGSSVGSNAHPSSSSGNSAAAAAAAVALRQVSQECNLKAGVVTHTFFSSEFFQHRRSLESFQLEFTHLFALKGVGVQ